MISESAYHIEIDSGGVARLPGTKVKVREVVEEHLAYGWSAEMIHDQHPDLPLPKIYAALAFFYDHEAEMLEELQRVDSTIDDLRAGTENASLRDRLQVLKHRNG